MPARYLNKNKNISYLVSELQILHRSHAITERGKNGHIFWKYYETRRMNILAKMGA